MELESTPLDHSGKVSCLRAAYAIMTWLGTALQPTQQAIHTSHCWPHWHALLSGARAREPVAQWSGRRDADRTVAGSIPAFAGGHSVRPGGATLLAHMRRNVKASAPGSAPPPDTCGILTHAARASGT